MTFMALSVIVIALLTAILAIYLFVIGAVRNHVGLASCASTTSLKTWSVHYPCCTEVLSVSLTLSRPRKVWVTWMRDHAT